MHSVQSVCVVGLGYIGLPTSAVLANAGLTVIGVDVNPDAVRSINAGKPHIVEPHLNELLQKVVFEKRFHAVEAPVPADAFIIAVPTPFREGHQPDLRFIKAACRSIGPVLHPGNLVVLESTSPVGTTELVSEWLAETRPDLTFPHNHGEESAIRVTHCPERVLPGQILREVIENHRIIGGITPRCAQAAERLYKIFVQGECHLTTARTAEMSKLAENAFRDVNIAFANELGLICDKFGIDVWSLIKIANLHPRVKILNPGPGVGGHCIAVDPWFIIAVAPDQAKLMRTARDVNDAKPRYVVAQILSKVEEYGARPIIACLGLAYKPDVDDLRESPAVEIVSALADTSALTVLAVEPYIDSLPRELTGKNIDLVSLDEALSKANMIVLLVDHKPFRAVDRSHLAGKCVIDTRGIW